MARILGCLIALVISAGAWGANATFERLARAAPTLDRKVLSLATRALGCTMRAPDASRPGTLSVIDFSLPEAVDGAVEHCLQSGTPLVVATRAIGVATAMAEEREVLGTIDQFVHIGDFHQHEHPLPLSKRLAVVDAGNVEVRSWGNERDDFAVRLGVACS